MGTRKLAWNLRIVKTSANNKNPIVTNILEPFCEQLTEVKMGCV
jgi:hypothetical protein